MVQAIYFLNIKRKNKKKEEKEDGEGMGRRRRKSRIGRNFNSRVVITGTTHQSAFPKQPLFPYYPLFPVSHPSHIPPLSPTLSI